MWWCLASRQNFHCLGLVSVSRPAASLLASVSTNLPRSCYCLEAPITEKPFFLPQRTRNGAICTFQTFVRKLRNLNTRKGSIAVANPILIESGQVPKRPFMSHPLYPHTNRSTWKTKGTKFVRPSMLEHKNSWTSCLREVRAPEFRGQPILFSQHILGSQTVRLKLNYQKLSLC